MSKVQGDGLSLVLFDPEPWDLVHLLANCYPSFYFYLPFILWRDQIETITSFQFFVLFRGARLRWFLAFPSLNSVEEGNWDYYSLPRFKILWRKEIETNTCFYFFAFWWRNHNEKTTPRSFFVVLFSAEGSDWDNYLFSLLCIF